jgi:hypothetical protein
MVPPAFELDAVLATLVVSDSIDKLLTTPSTFYDTAILYPDRNQLRSTEPFLGFALLGLPLRALRLNDVDIYEVVRWLMVTAAVAYAYLLFRIFGVGIALAAAGAVLCGAPRGLLYGIERLQFVSIPLFLPAMYHGIMIAVAADRTRLLGHSVGLFVGAAMYPLLGAVNATIVAMAGVLALPWLAKALFGLRRQGRLLAFMLPLVLAVAVDAVVLGPWILDRADLAVYASDAFLQIKHWGATRLPGRLSHAWVFADSLIGRGPGLCLVAVAFLSVHQRYRRKPLEPPSSGVATGTTVERHIWPLLVAAFLVVATSIAGLAQVQRIAALAFHMVCWVTLVVYWRDQMRAHIGGATKGELASSAMLLSLGLGVFVSLMSFGPVYVSNDNALASSLLRALFEVVPPLKSIREFNRLWIFGAILLSGYAVVRLSVTLRRHPPAFEPAAAVLVMLGALSTIYTRELVASSYIEAPEDLVDLVAHSRRTGGVYVHRDMNWNSGSGVLMIAAARDTNRPFVNGYLGISPPWFDYARNVLHRFPDPEAVWLLRRWRVETVVQLPDSREAVDASSAEKVFERGGAAVFDVAHPSAASDMEHPSEAVRGTPGQVKIPATFSPAAVDARDAGVTVAVPEQFEIEAVEVRFHPSVVDQVPVAVAIYEYDGARGSRINRGRSGEWLHSLAADALVRRASPVATISVVSTSSKALLLEFESSARPPIDRIVFVGRWSH